MSGELIHGKVSSYTRGACRCDLCREASRLYSQEYRNRTGRNVPLQQYREEQARNLVHGSTRYKQGCRCSVCQEGCREEARRRKNQPVPQHGTVSGYQNYGCRCFDCVRAKSDNTKKRKNLGARVGM